MKTERRHELQHNVLADALGSATENIKPYSQVILGVLLALIVVFGLWRYFSAQSQAEATDGWNSYLSASATGDLDGLKQVAEQYANTPAAQWANLGIGDQNLALGINESFTNRNDARDKLRQAEDAYAAVLQDASDPLLLQRATFGLGEVYESLVELDKARTEYESLGKRWPDSAYATIAKERLDDLAATNTRAFYDWFDQHEPQPASSEPGIPGHRPSFNLDSIDDGPVVQPGAPGSLGIGDVPDSGKPPSEAPTQPPAAPDDPPPADAAAPAPSQPLADDGAATP